MLNSKIGTIDSKNCYAIPEGYFEGLAAHMLQRIREHETADSSDDSEITFLATKEMPYVVPAGYFEKLSSDILQNISAENPHGSVQEELTALSPLLAGMKKDNPYFLPEDYFKNIAVVKAPAKVISLTGRKWFRYAAAAVVAGIIVLAALVIPNTNNDTGKSLAKFEKTLEKEIDRTSDEELDEFIDQFTDAGLTGKENAATTDANDLLKDIPDNELKLFLEETADLETQNADELSLLN